VLSDNEPLEPPNDEPDDSDTDPLAPLVLSVDPMDIAALLRIDTVPPVEPDCPAAMFTAVAALIWICLPAKDTSCVFD
jgi:hypothetical protein